MGKAKQTVDSCQQAMQNTASSLQQAMASAEKQSNKATIQSAINAVNEAEQALNNFQD